MAKEFGVKTIYSDVGAPYLAEKMFAQKEKMICGGEEVGGIVWPKFSLAKDGIFATCKFMEMVSQKRLSKWFDELPQYYNSKTKIQATKNQKERVLKSLQSKADSKKIIPLIGGFRLNLGDSWVLVRASGTEEYIRVFAESRTEEKANRLTNEYKNLVEQSMDQVKK